MRGTEKGEKEEGEGEGKGVKENGEVQKGGVYMYMSKSSWG